MSFLPLKFVFVVIICETARIVKNNGIHYALIINVGAFDYFLTEDCMYKIGVVICFCVYTFLYQLAVVKAEDTIIPQAPSSVQDTESTVHGNDPEFEYQSPDKRIQIYRGNGYNIIHMSGDPNNGIYQDKSDKRPQGMALKCQGLSEKECIDTYYDRKYWYEKQRH